MTSTLPPIPRFIFTIFEPLTLLAGFIVPVADIQDFARAQVPSTPPIPTTIPLTATERVLALQLANMYGLTALIGIGVLYGTREARVVRNFLIACAVADIGHLWATYAGMGYERFVDVAAWNQLAWGNIGVTTFLFVARVLYLAGLLGADRVPASSSAAGKKRV